MIIQFGAIVATFIYFAKKIARLFMAWVRGLTNADARGHDYTLAWAVIVGSLVVAAAVAYGGLVAFVGLAAPHMARWMVGPLHRALLPASALTGAIVVTVADAIARSALPPAEIPLGLVTAVAGGPFFIVLLARRLRS